MLANDHVDVDVACGEIHALMGENGAGKSTLMSILYGLRQPDAGTIVLHGAPVTFASPAQAIDAGVGMVQQEFALFPQLTVAENVVFGREPTRRGLLSRKAAVLAVAELISRHDLRLRPGDRVADLPVGARQQVEILKLLYRQADVLILDEPTAVLTPAETERLFGVLRGLAASGRTVLFVSHKLQEVLAVSDHVTVMRDGRVSAHGATGSFTPASLASAMVGREVDLDRAYPRGTPGAPVLELPELTVRSGEIVGIAGVAGNGQNALVSRIRKVAHVPEERGEVGSASQASLADNLAVGFHRRKPLVRGGFLRPSKIRKHARSIVARFDVRGSIEQPMGTLSGGNQQKAILGRELTHGAALLVVEQPTRGVDVGAIENIHAHLIVYRDAGHGILLVSAELSEILALSDRILVMYEGRISAEFSRAEADPERIGLAMAGGAP
ncbi:ABC transporter ATP-binding protein [Kibdelosporangium philippinense]|uniref:ABC transporter ATP-binding protein n=1 Tax=Kibdelosporangium philippinense TaxID=211113 RepID=A0ABS8ZWK2_9PSEU|nr:ABC transporter ATP-binding protein [Kibdelosporangium philippinense]MCE7010758.1 ABC transporter ATP-binding protein [Kibdelosporangium philippinense]